MARVPATSELRKAENIWFPLDIRAAPAAPYLPLTLSPFLLSNPLLLKALSLFLKSPWVPNRWATKARRLRWLRVTRLVRVVVC